MKNNMSDMIATMALNGATKEELNRAIEYSAAVIQLEKMRDAKRIDELEKKYCDGAEGIKSKHKCVLAPDGVCPDGCHNSDGYLCDFDDCPYYGEVETC